MSSELKNFGAKYMKKLVEYLGQHYTIQGGGESELQILEDLWIACTYPLTYLDGHGFNCPEENAWVMDTRVDYLLRILPDLILELDQ